ncbi:benzoyl-CoA 2,3-epoxidase subunit BoxA [Ideonella sp. BN130291]|uniref:benzoyl-CoA 2,3-epoxidase subunit BoxA n=1 Tax=Ideonella sp. BN130291 TaxID=3112940 RepID=UPI002E26B714|nr:benzoyl-CoA 2,3-epoxidase subunit BoxA [Ideonella sp. BN130291]
MDQAANVALIRQHLIDPEICIRCNTCEATCPVGAITHDDRNYVVRADVCNGCMACISPCPTGSIDNWRTVPRERAYSIEEQLGWDVLPPELAPKDVPAQALAPSTVAAPVDPLPVFEPTRWASTLPPWSAAHAYTNLYGPKSPVTATVTGNINCTESGFANETHHIVLDFGAMPFPVLEGQSIGIVPPGLDATGRPHVARQYSVASPRNGERAGYNNLALTVKRVTADHECRPVRGVASNHLCDLQVGDTVQVIGPFGSSFLMPNHPRSNIVMICTGTGSAPMRAMTEWRRRLRKTGKFEGGKLMLFFGARTPQELPYFGPLQSLPKDFIDINLAFSRLPDQPKRYVQDLMRERAADLAALLKDPSTCFYVCGLKSMEQGVMLALQDVASSAGLAWDTLGAALQREGRLHLETY